MESHNRNDKVYVLKSKNSVPQCEIIVDNGYVKHPHVCV